MSDQPTKQASTRDAGSGILLAGMHRSGTSALARMFADLGFWLGDEAELMPAHPADNPTGYWERRDVLVAHEAYLHALDLDWDRISRLPDDVDRGFHGRRLAAVLTTILSAFPAGRPWLIKDPRLCLLLPLWARIAPQAVPVVAVRNPLEIASSLLDTHRGVYPTGFSLLLWQAYMARLLHSLRGKPVLFVGYRHCLQDEGGQRERLHAHLSRRGFALPALAPMHEPRLVSRLYRRQSDPSALDRLTPDQRDLLSWLEQAAQSSAEVTVPDRIWPVPASELAEYEASFDDRLRRGRERGLVIGADRMEAQLQDIRQRNEHAHAALKNQLASMWEEQRVLRLELVRQALDHKAAQFDLGATKALLAEVQAQRDGLRAQVDGQGGHLANIQNSLSWRLTAPLRMFQRRPERVGAGSGERWLYRLYYRIPGLSQSRKRKLVIWLHEHLPWLTRRTLSYQIWRSAQGAPFVAAGQGWCQPLSGQERQRQYEKLAERPLVSLLMPTYNTDPKWLEAAIDSVRAQSYDNWQLCIADDCSTRADTRQALERLDDAKIKLVLLEENRGISAASNAALALAEGAYVGLLDHDDELAPDALLLTLATAQERKADVVYTDEDKIDDGEEHSDPHFKPGYSEDMLLAQNYICHFLLARRALVEQVGGFRTSYEGAQDHDLLLRLVEQAGRVERVPRVLYHWRMHAGSTAADPGAKPASWRSGVLAVEDALQRRGIEGAVEYGQFPHTYRVRRAIQGRPLVSILVPFRDMPQMLRTCIESVLERTAYDDFEVLGIDNGSVEAQTHDLMAELSGRDRRVRFIRHDVPFNYSVINNFGARHARGEHLLFLNNDTEVIAPEWLEAMLEHSQRPDVGVVGARLLYDDDTLQHAGVIAGLGGVAGHSHLFVPKDAPGYFCRPHLIQDMSAVTFACAMSRKEVFERLGGLNEHDLKIAFNDVDYCLRAREQGFRVLYTPYALLYHYESKSRGYEDSQEKQARFAGEIRYIQQRHHEALVAGDPFYNPNFPLNMHSFAVPGR